MSQISQQFESLLDFDSVSPFTVVGDWIYIAVVWFSLLFFTIWCLGLV